MIGTGILKGMAVTARNFFGSYFEKERLITVQYPEERSPLPENYRNFPFLIYDTDDAEAGLRCVACKICEKECPPQCIYIVKSEDKKPDYMGKPQFYPAVFDIDISVCMRPVFERVALQHKDFPTVICQDAGRQEPAILPPRTTARCPKKPAMEG